MSQKKNSTRKKKSRAELRREIAQHLAAVLANPETPVMLYNDIAESLSDMSSDINYDTAEMIERSLTAHVAKEEKRQKGSAR
jgi:hypothetical protein